MGTVISFENLEYHGLLHILSKFYCLEILEKLGFKAMLILPQWMNRKVGILTYNIKFYFEVILNFIIYLCGKTNVNNFDPERLGVIVSH